MSIVQIAHKNGIPRRYNLLLQYVCYHQNFVKNCYDKKVALFRHEPKFKNCTLLMFIVHLSGFGSIPSQFKRRNIKVFLNCYTDYYFQLSISKVQYSKETMSIVEPSPCVVVRWQLYSAPLSCLLIKTTW